MIEDILPATVEAFDTFEDPPEPALFPEEEAQIGRAVEKRRREFATARYCARQAMAKLGVAPAPVLSGPRGEPRWPQGVAGSITHCAGYRAAALTTAPATLVGIDAEPDEPLPPDVLPVVSLPREREMLRRLAGDHPRICWDRLLFSAKESVYKAWFPLMGRWLGFHEAAITVDPRGTFTAHLMAQGLRWRGRWMAGNGLVLTALVLTGEPA